MKKVHIKDTVIEHSNTSEGEHIELAIKRALENGETIGEQVAKIYTEKKDGVMAGYDIRTDRWDVALDAQDVTQKTTAAKREALIKSSEPKGDETAIVTGKQIGRAHV